MFVGGMPLSPFVMFRNRVSRPKFDGIAVKMFSHTHENTQRRKLQRTSPQPATIENEPEVNTYYEALLTKSRRDAPDPIPDPLLSSFISIIPFPNLKDKSKRQ